MKRQTHFRSAELGFYTVHNARHLYVLDASKHDDTDKRCSRHMLVYDPLHQIGTLSKKLDLSHHSSISDAIEIFLSRGGTLKILNLESNVEVNSKFISMLHSNDLCRCVLENLSIAGCHGIQLTELTQLCNFDQLRCLNLSRIDFVNDTFVESICAKLPLLHSLDVSECPQLTDRSLASVSNHLADRLHDFRCSRNKNITQAGANAIVLNCEALVVLSLNDCAKINFIGVIVKTFGMHQFVSRKISTLQLDGFAVDANSRSLQWIGTALPDLRELSLRDCKALSDSMLAGIVAGCPHLSHVDVSGCRGVSNSAIEMIIRKLSVVLTFLGIADVSRDLLSNSIKDLTEKCITLKCLDVSYNAALTELVAPQVNICGSITHLKANYCSVTALNVAQLAPCFPLIVNIGMAGSSMNDAALEILALTCKHLRVLDVSDCLSLTDRGVEQFCRHAPQIQVLKLSQLQSKNARLKGEDVIQYTDQVLRTLFLARHLVEVSLCNQLGILFTSKWVRKIFPIKGNHCIEQFDLRGCENLASTNLSTILKACSHLNDVHLPEKFFNSDVSSRRFWKETFSRTVYVKPYSDSNYAEQFGAYQRAKEVVVSTKKVSLAESIAGRDKQRKDGSVPVRDRSELLGFHVLQPRPDMRILQYRDQYVRRRLLEYDSATFIQTKWRLFKIWKRFRYRIMARKIANTYKIILNRRRKKKRILEITYNSWARRLQRFMYRRFFLYTRAARKIQHLIRVFINRKEKQRRWLQNQVIVHIQKAARGYIVRTSERFLLVQLYMRLPMFWKELMKFNPSQNEMAVKHRFRKELTVLDKVEDTRKETRSLLNHIRHDVIRDRPLPLRLPFTVPQPFDKNPYVSLSNGKKMNFFSHKDSIISNDFDKDGHKLERRDRTSAPIHIFNIKFWPLTNAPRVADLSTDLHDPNLNSFEVASNYRISLTCESCLSRLKLVQCNSCKLGFCFPCAYRVHGRRTAKRTHDMQVCEPRLVRDQQATSSLVYNIDFARGISHELRYLVKSMRSKGEIARMKKEKELMKELEQQEEARRLAHLRASQESQERHMAATHISLLFRRAHAKKLVQEKRVHIHLEKTIRAQLKFFHSIVILQKTVRVFLVRIWFFKQGYRFKNCKQRHRRERINRKGRHIDLEGLRKLVDKNLSRRIMYSRWMLFKAVHDSVVQLKEFLDANISYWLRKYEKSQQNIERLVSLREHYFQLHREQAQELVQNPPSGTEQRLQSEAAVKFSHSKLKTVDERLENSRNISWWITMHLRSCYRRREATKVRYRDTWERLVWIADEGVIVQRIIFEMQQRIDRLASEPELTMVQEWITRYLNFAQKHMITMDSLQETILKEELVKLEADRHRTKELDSLIEELVMSLEVDSQYLAEKVYLENYVKKIVGDPDLATIMNEELLLLRQKESKLSTSIIDRLKDGLQQKLDEEDSSNALLYGFPHDDPDLTAPQLQRIEAALIDKYQPPGHCRVEDFLDVYLVQPWLAEQSVEDVRMEENADAKDLKLGKIQEELHALKYKLQDMEDQMQALRKAIGKKESEIAGAVLMEGIEMEADAADQPVKSVTELSKEKAALQVELSLLSASMDSTANLQGPTQVRMDALAAEISVVREELVIRAKAREKASKNFFDFEARTEADLVDEVQTTLTSIEQQLEQTQRALKHCENVVQSDPAIEEIVLQSAPIEEFGDVGIARNPFQFRVQELLRQVTALSRYSDNSDGESKAESRRHVHPLAYVRVSLTYRILALQSTVSHLTFHKHLLEGEEALLQSFPTRRQMLERVMLSFTQTLLDQRRQKSLQLSIQLRKKRLEDLRSSRLLALREDRQKAIEEAKDNQKRDQRRRKEKEEKRLSKVLAKKLKKTIRGTKDAVRDFRHGMLTRMDEEEQRMAKILRQKNKKDEGTANIPEGVREMLFTVGQQETEMFQKQNDHLRDKGLPFFLQMDRGLGNGLFLWTQSSFDSSVFLTHIHLSNSEPTSEYHKDPEIMIKEKFRLISHPQTKLQFWVKCDKKKSKGLKSFQLSFTMEEENEFMLDNFEPLEPKLSAFDLPETVLWLKKVNKTQAVADVNVNKLIAEYTNAKEMLKERPDDKNLAAFLSRLTEQVEKAHKKEEKKEIVNPLAVAKDLMALTDEEVEKWVKVFAQIDKKKTGKVTSEDIFEFARETPTGFSREIFALMDAEDRQGKIEFADFVLAIGTYCFFGKRDIIKMMYMYVDKSAAGFVSKQQLVNFLGELNPYEKQRMKRALKSITIEEDAKVTLADFVSLNEKFPAIFIPAFLLQDSFRNKIMGTDWWFEKLSKYRSVRGKMAMEGAHADKIVQQELIRFQEDHEKNERMQLREQAIKQETSEVRKVILRARQLVDEFS